MQLTSSSRCAILQMSILAAASIPQGSMSEHEAQPSVNHYSNYVISQDLMSTHNHLYFSALE